MHVGLNGACRAHDPGRAHPDQSARLDAIESAIADHPAVTWASPHAARRITVETVHDPEYLDELEAFCARGGGPWDPDTVASRDTWRASLAAAGVAQWVAEEAIGAAGSDVPFGLTRPPGHHAMYDTAMGFCFFNNVAIATETLLTDHGIDRVAIVDWDVHHANGTEQYVIDRDGVSLISIHQRGLYPGTGTFRSEQDDSVLNVPLPTDLDDGAYLHAFEAVVPPAIEASQPDVLLVSCGFDAHERDVLSSQRLSADGYGLLTDGIASIAQEMDAGVGIVLEGGYAIEQIGSCARAMVDAFAGDIPERPIASPTRSLEDALEQARQHPLLANA